MTTYYKLTDIRNRTFYNTQWGKNVTHTALGDGSELCSSGVIHVYDHPLKAVLFNPIHGDFQPYHLWTCRVEQIVADDHTKVGVKTCTTLKQILAPTITTNQRVRIALLCALEISSDAKFIEWAHTWLDDSNRTYSTAAAAASVAAYAVDDHAVGAVTAFTRSRRYSDKKLIAIIEQAMQEEH